MSKFISDYEYLRKEMNECLKYWGQDINEKDIRSFYDTLEERLNQIENLKLYRYMPAEYYSIRNIEKDRIHLTPNGEFNDVYEGIPSCCMANLRYNDLSALRDCAYICCFSETFDNNLMWSHYAKSHTGLCVEYDLKLLKDKDIINHIFPIVYKDVRGIEMNIFDLIDQKKYLNNKINKNAIDDSDLSKLLPLFITKGECWSYENEWRIIYTKPEIYERGKSNHIETDLLNLFFPCMTSVYLGFRIDKEVKRNIIEIQERKRRESGQEIKLYDMKLSNSKYELESIEIKK